jgi:hypothetical protein
LLLSKSIEARELIKAAVIKKKSMSNGFRANNDCGFGVPQGFWIKKGQGIHIKLKQGNQRTYREIIHY